MRWPAPLAARDRRRLPAAPEKTDPQARPVRTRIIAPEGTTMTGHASLFGRVPISHEERRRGEIGYDGLDAHAAEHRSMLEEFAGN